MSTELKLKIEDFKDRLDRWIDYNVLSPFRDYEVKELLVHPDDFDSAKAIGFKYRGRKIKFLVRKAEANSIAKKEAAEINLVNSSVEA